MATRLEVITGPMFSKKSTRLIEKLDWAAHEEKRTLLLKPKADTRNKRVAFRKKALKIGGENLRNSMPISLTPKKKYLNYSKKTSPK